MNQNINPLFPGHEPSHTKTDQPSSRELKDSSADPKKSIYSQAPDTKEEIKDVQAERGKRSVHQQFMYKLSVSGKSLAEIQVAWHNYYQGLSDSDKHAVWQEFYDSNKPSDKPSKPQPKQTSLEMTSHNTRKQKGSKNRPAPIKDLQEQILNKVSVRQRQQAKRHLRSLAFGLGMGAMVLIFLLFGFFNERFIAPFITPSRNVSATPIIVDSNASSTDSKIIIPKINVELPVVYTEPSIEEKAVDKALENGVLHYATTPYPGQRGNGVIFGHSANNILNPGKYKFAFVLLHRLVIGDTFMLEKDGKRYVYKVYERKIVEPQDVSVLGPASKPSTFTLITCDPPGTSWHRLIVTGEQISPDPSTNTASTVNNNEKPRLLPSNAPSLWQRFINWLLPGS